MPNNPKSLLEYLVTNLVDAPEKATIVEEVDPYGGILLRLSVSQEDMGKIIGKSGKTIRAIRTLIKSLAIKQSLHCSVVLTEEY